MRVFQGESPSRPHPRCRKGRECRQNCGLWGGSGEWGNSVYRLFRPCLCAPFFAVGLFRDMAYPVFLQFGRFPLLLPPCPFSSLFYFTMNPRIKHSNLFEKTLDSSSGGCYTIPENKAEPQCVLTYERSSSMVNTKKTGKSRVFVLKSAGCVVCALFVVGFDLGCMEVLNY